MVTPASNVLKLPLGPSNPPEPPAGLLPDVEAAWGQFWQSPIARLVIAADLPALRRLFVLRSEQERLWAAGRAEPVVNGHGGQPVLRPELKAAVALEAAILGLEDRFGCSPAARSRLREALIEAVNRPRLQDLNRAVADDATDSADDVRAWDLDDGRVEPPHPPQPPEDGPATTAPTNPEDAP